MPGPTVVLVHGAFADASGFAGVIRELESAGHTALAPPNPLRGVAFDASVVSDVVKAIDGPVVLVGHSYGGAVIGQASAGLENVTGLVFLAAFGLEVGESCASVQQPFPPPRRAGRASRPGSWSPSTTTRSRRTRNGSWRSGWAPRPRPLTARTLRSSQSRSPWRRSSVKRCGDLVDRDAVLALPGERAAVA